MKIPISWTCPKCGTVNVTLHGLEEQRNMNIEYCDTEVGGCDEPFVIETVRTVEVETVYSMKVEYQND